MVTVYLVSIQQMSRQMCSFYLRAATIKGWLLIPVLRYLSPVNEFLLNGQWRFECPSGYYCIFAIATANGATFSRLTVKDKRAVSFNIIAKWAAICPLEIYRCKLQKHTVILHYSFLSCKYRSRNQPVVECTKNAIFLKGNSFAVRCWIWAGGVLFSKIIHL